SHGCKEAALAVNDRGLDLERQGSGWAAEGRPVPEHGVAVLDHDVIRPDRRDDPVDLEDPAARAAGRIAPDLVDIRAERRRRDVVEELTCQAGRLERVERGRLHIQSRLSGAEDRLRLAFDADMDTCGERRWD